MSALNKMEAGRGALVAIMDRVIAGRISLVHGSKMPLLRTLVLRLKLVEDVTCKTAWTDGRSLGFNPRFIASLTHNRLVGLIGHEVLHCALRHPWRRGNRDHKRFNLAADKTINSDLRIAGYELPDGAYYAEGDEIGKSVEWIYAHLPIDEPEPEQPEPEPGESEQEPDENETSEDEQDGDGESDESDDKDGDGESDESDGAGDGSGEGESDGDGDGEGSSDGQSNGKSDGGGAAGDGDGDPLGEVRDAPITADADGEPAPSEQEWREAVAVAAALCTAQGLMSADAARIAGEALKPRVDPYSLVLRWMQERTASDYSWMRPNPRYMGQGFYLPALHSTQMGEMAVFVDTSGSMDDAALTKAKGIVQEVLDECNPAGLSVYFADAKVCHVERIERGDLLTWQPKGGGGTDFRPVMTALDEDDHRPVCCICISDLQGTFPVIEPEVPTLWLSTIETDWSGKPVLAPFGETVFVGD